tara:strand:- start:1250 stop:1426 length:177 start_codon:yes stop_codon:yes gene_type:complete
MDVDEGHSQQKRGEKKFTMEDLKEIVAKVLAEKEEELIQQYNEVLSQRLQGMTKFPLV